MFNFQVDIFFDLTIIFLLSFTITSILIPIILKFLDRNKIYDKKSSLKKHKGFIPTLGGVAIILGIVISQFFFLLLFIEYRITFIGYEYLVLCSLILFIVGIVDDLINLDSMLKFLIQLIVALIMTWKAGLLIDSFGGILGVFKLPLHVSYFFSILVILFLINSYNLIDGIDTIASVLGIGYSLFFAICCYYNNLFGELILLISIIGALISFWYYNKTPAKIFMGDSGTLVMGLFISFFSIRLLNPDFTENLLVSPVYLIGLLVYPITDTIRVFCIRIYNRIPPFRGDRRHIHHILVDSGFSHIKTTLYILISNLGLMFLLIIFNFGINEMLLICIIYIMIFLKSVSVISKKY